MKPFMTGGNGVRYLTRKNIEQISERVLRAYWKLPDALLEPQRVVPDVLLESLLGLTISFRHLSIDRCTLGLTCFHEIGIEIYDDPSEDFFMMDGKSVLIETDLNEPYASVGRRNFTVMHEGCHHILHMLFPFDCDYGMSARRVLKYRMTGYKRSSMDVAEWQTDTLASFLLMPTSLLRKNMNECGIPNGIPILNPLWRSDDYQRFVALSRKMGVSKQALAIRLKQMKLIGEDYTANPYSMLDID